MKCILLAAGYATRLYPLTKNFPKPLLQVADDTILGHILKKIERVEDIDEVFVVTNACFVDHFTQWASSVNSSKKIRIFNDGTSTNETRLGAVGDIRFVLEETGMDEDLMILAGDNLFEFELTNFVDFFQQAGSDCISCHIINDRERIKRTGVVKIDEKGRVLLFQEKPQEPASNLGVPPFYLYKKETLPLIQTFLEEGNKGDAPGHFIPWLLDRKEIRAFRFEGQRFDIGTLESYESVKRIFAGK